MKKKIHMICNAHIDPIWLWEWPEGVSAVLSTFQSAVNLAEKYDYIFCHNEAVAYQYVEKYAPDLFVKIQKLVKEGKWHIMGGWFLQPDCNMPSGESFVRQIREGQRYFKEKFGECPTTAINFDPFGHTVGLVQIMKKCGQDSYLFTRPFIGQVDLPEECFIWRGLDGSEIKGLRSQGSYGTKLGDSVGSILRRGSRRDLPVDVALWGVGNHGGGPSAKDLADIEAELLPLTDRTFIHSTPEAMFAELHPTAVFDKSLHLCMPGCYTTMYHIKKLHAQLEQELYLAEKASAVAYARGALKEYPEAELRSATYDLLNAEFHDVLPGTSIPSGEASGLHLLHHGILEAERLKIKAFFALSATEPVAAPGEYPIVVFNPHAHEVNDNIECEFNLSDQNGDDVYVSHITVRDQNGNVLPHQVIKEECNLSLDWRKRIIFKASLAPLSISRYSIYVEFKEKDATGKTDSMTFDNGRKYVRINPETGLLESYRVDGVEYVKEGFGLVAFKDNEDPWAMQTETLCSGERPFVLAKKPDGPFRGMRSVQVVEDGDIFLGIEAFFKLGNIKARILYKIYKNNDDLDIDVTLYMGDINKIVKLKLPVAFDGQLIGQTAYGTEDLFMDSRENVAQRFVALDGKDQCLGLLNRGVYGNHFANSAIYTSLVRGVTHSAHPIPNRPLVTKDQFTTKIDQGENNYSFRLTPTKRNALERKAQEFTMKPYALNIFPIPTATDGIGDFRVSLGDDVTAVTAVKKADDRDAIIFRVLNNSPEGRETYLQVNDAKISLTFGKYEVKTVLYENGTLTESYELLI